VRTARQLFPVQPICLVAGNHEFYQRDHAVTLAALREDARDAKVNFLHRDSFVGTIAGQDIRVLGVTLWTDFLLFGDPVVNMLAAKKGMNDFRLIRVDDHVLTPQDTLLWHQEDRHWLLGELDKPFGGLTIVMTHHAPVSFASAPQYVNDALAPCFASRMEDLLCREDVALVVWGHTHHAVDQTIGTTRFISSQSGYATGKESVETNDFGKMISLSD
jgi:UDP-2,3-diacylglucosamine pyrophosphatase LpxH